MCEGSSSGVLNFSSLFFFLFGFLIVKLGAKLFFCFGFFLLCLEKGVGEISGRWQVLQAKVGTIFFSVCFHIDKSLKNVI